MEAEKKLRYSIHAAGLSLLCLLALLSWFLQKQAARPRLSPEEIAAFAAYARADSLRADSLARARAQSKAPANKPAKSVSARETSASQTSAKKASARETSAKETWAKKDTVRAAERAAWEAFKPLDVTRVELNTADKEQLVGLRGIADYYAQRILDYREKLGGFARIEQLMEIQGIDAERFALFYQKIWTDPALLRKLNLSRATEAELAAHPYIGKYGARSILRWRTHNGGQCRVQDLLEQGLLEAGRAEKLRPYCAE